MSKIHGPTITDGLPRKRGLSITEKWNRFINERFKNFKFDFWVSCCRCHHDIGPRCARTADRLPDMAVRSVRLPLQMGECFHSILKYRNCTGNFRGLSSNEKYFFVFSRNWCSTKAARFSRCGGCLRWTSTWRSTSGTWPTGTSTWADRTTNCRSRKLGLTCTGKSILANSVANNNEGNDSSRWFFGKIWK